MQTNQLTWWARLSSTADRGRQRAHGAVGEVDDPRGAVGQHEAEGQQPVDRAELRPVEDLPPRRRVRPEGRHGEEQDEGGGHGQHDAAQARRRGGPGAGPTRERGRRGAPAARYPPPDGVIGKLEGSGSAPPA